MDVREEGRDGIDREPRLAGPRQGLHAGWSLLEVLIAASLIVILLVPILGLSIHSNRIGFTANRLIDVTIFGQTMLEALERMTPEEIVLGLGKASEEGITDPAGEDGFLNIFSRTYFPSSTTVPSPATAPDGGPGSRFEAWKTHLSTVTFEHRLDLSVDLKALGEGRIAVKLRMAYPRLPTEPEGQQELVLRGTVTRPSP